MLRSNRRPRARQLSYQPLEARQLLAGDVSVSVNGSTLQITGDIAANQIQVSSNSDGNVVVTGTDTTINGAADSFVVSENFRWLALNMGNGNDEASIDGISVNRELRFLGGNGNDRLTVNNVDARYVHVQGNDGDDVLDLENFNVTKSIYLHLGAGNDVVGVNELDAGRNFKVFGESGNDTFSSSDLSVGRKLRLNMGQGDDNALLSGATSVGKTAKFRLGSGSDFLGVLPDSDTQSQFRRRLTVDAAAGDDTVAIDNRVDLGKRAKINGGSGSDVITSSEGEFTGNARERRFEGQGSDNVAALVDTVNARLAAVGIDTESTDDSGIDAEPQTLTLTGASVALNFVEDSEPVSIDSDLVLTGPAATTVSGAVITVNGFQSGQDQLVFDDTSSIAGVFDAGVLTLSGNSTISDYQLALREVTFQNTSGAPNTDDRELEIVVTSDQGDASVSRLLTISSINDSPSIALADSAITTSALPLVLDDQLELSDVDSTEFSSAVVAITSGFESGQDRLTFTALDDVNGTFDPSTGALTISSLSGDLELETLQDVLRSVTFDSDSGLLIDSDRTIRFTVFDDLNASVSADLEVELNS